MTLKMRAVKLRGQQKRGMNELNNIKQGACVISYKIVGFANNSFTRCKKGSGVNRVRWWGGDLRHLSACL